MTDTVVKPNPELCSMTDTAEVKTSNMETIRRCRRKRPSGSAAKSSPR